MESDAPVNKRGPGLLDIPLELRQQIFDRARRHDLCVACESPVPGNKRALAKPFPQDSFSAAIALLGVNKQIRREMVHVVGQQFREHRKRTEEMRGWNLGGRARKGHPLFKGPAPLKERIQLLIQSTASGWVDGGQ